MTLYDEYCYNIMEEAIADGAKQHGLPKDICVSIMNIIAGARGLEEYAKGWSERERKKLFERYDIRAGGKKQDAVNSVTTEEFRSAVDELAEVAQLKGREDDKEDGEEMGD